jgi:general secretion pathway protein J
MTTMLLRRPQTQHGFTLIEVIVSIGILAMMTTSMYLILRNSSEVQQESSARAALNQMGRNATEIMRKELSQAYLSQNQTEHWKTLFKAEDTDPIDEVYFVAKSHEKRYADVKESDLAEIHYTSESDRDGGVFRTLLHREAPIIDDEPERGGTVLAMAHNVRELELRYYDEKKEEWVEEWDSESADYVDRLPRAVEIRLELEDAEGRSQSFLTRTMVYAAAP